MLAVVDDVGRIEMAEGLRSPCCDAPLTPQASARRTDDAVEIVCQSCHAVVLRVEIPPAEPDWDYD